MERTSKNILTEFESDQLASGSDLVAAASSYGGYCEQGVSIEIALLSLLAAFGVSFAILYMASTTNTGRRKRKKREDVTLTDQIEDMIWMSKFTVHRVLGAQLTPPKKKMLGH